MSELVKGLLDYTRIGKNFKIKKIDPNKILEAVLQDLHSLLENKNVKIKIEKLPKINGLETEIRSVFMNLISNAVKYSKKNVTPIIKIGAIKDVNVVKFFVEDNGIGIEKAYLKRIFLIFQRLHNKNEYEGTGIGLAHCQKIIELHGGKIWAESIPNLGSSFFFTIPA
ncbi:MAG: ATP-binding protein, partial [Flavobacteriales bacterium]